MAEFQHIVTRVIVPAVKHPTTLLAVFMMVSYYGKASDIKLTQSDDRRRCRLRRERLDRLVLCTRILLNAMTSKTWISDYVISC